MTVDRDRIRREAEPVGKPWPKPMPHKITRRHGELGEALEKDLGPVQFLNPGQYVYVERCDDCGCPLEGGHCYCCHPVFGYGERFRAERHK